MGVKEAPLEVQNAYAALRKSLGKRLSLHKISGNYYVYEYAMVKDARLGKTIVRTFYIGNITKDGIFIAKGSRPLAKLELIETSNDTTNEVEEREAIALRNLSMNGRMSMQKLAERIDMSVTGTRHFVNRLEKKYGIRYFAELDVLKMGYHRYVAFVKFKSKRPGVDHIRNAFEKDPHVALVAMLKGKYDMMVIFYLENTESIAKFVYKWRSSTALSGFTAKWYITPLNMSLGTALPLREQVVELFKGKIWQRSKTSPRKQQNQLTQNEYDVLKELINDGSVDFKEIDGKYHLGHGRSNYAFYKFKKDGILERISITMNGVNPKYNAIFVIQTNNYDRFNKDRANWFREAVGYDKNWIDKYAYRGDIGMPDGIFCIVPIFQEDEFHRTEETLSSIGGTEVYSMIITDILIGSLCYRSFDNAYSSAHRILVSEYGMKQVDRTEY